VDIFQLLERDHQEVDELLCRLQSPVGVVDFDRSGRQYLLDRLISVASRHEAAEEMVFWPQVRRRLPEGAELAQRALQEERDAKAVLDLLRFVKSEPEIADECRRLHALVRKHAEFEEQVVFPSMRQHTTWMWRTLTAMKFRAARRTGPTRPHPHGPDQPLGMMTIGAPAVMMDHLRDLRNRTRRHPTGFEEPDRTDAIRLLTRDHAQITRLLAQIDDQPDADDMLVHQVIRELSIHDSIERQYLYPLVRDRLEDGPSRFQHLLSEHAAITRLAADLDVYRFHDGARAAWLQQLVITVRTHIEAEEAGVLPALAARMTREELIDLGLQLEVARAKAPTRPHRHSVATGVGARVSRVVVGPMDRTRDALSKRRHRKGDRFDPGSSGDNSTDALSAEGGGHVSEAKHERI
jgi:hemerythrin superfamily protein